MTATEDRTGEIRFETSGSTGVARRWFRLPLQMEREVELIGTGLVGPVDQVINYAPPQHLFGALFGQWLPRMAEVRVHHAWADPFEPPAVSPGARVLVVCVPMAWDLLRRTWPSLRHAGSVVALHSAAAPPGSAYEFVRRAAPLLRAHEILGSTETGGIAHRPLGPDGDGAAWQVFPDVTCVRAAGAGQGEELVVRSPRLARPENEPRPPAKWSTGDLVDFLGPGAFRLVGRSGSLLKVNGVKVHLAEVARQLSARLPDTDCAVMPLPGDPLAGEGYAVFWSCGPRRARGDTLADIRSALRGFPSPSRVIELTVLPRTAAGKPDTRLLTEALRPPAGARFPEKGE
ncbi:acyl-CoA synthetase [Streptomyces sp. NPDC008125]|uniref:acyl-CoA synthetase n=1 Tax=Streptomyces sp. NPDC008125 TaxID=3364811 RepID=UPI0036EE46A4